jgi:hypothetical protein
MEELAPDLDTPAGVLAAVREDTALVDAVEVRRLQRAVDWAAMHSVDSIAWTATYYDCGGDTGMPVAGPGAPLVAEFSVPEFAAAIGVSTDVGKAYLGEAVELRYRLGRVWARVVAGDLVPWKARKIAKATIILSLEAAAYVDRHVAPVAHKVSWAQTERLVEEAIARFMPEEAERRRRAAADGRRVEIDTRQTTLLGTSRVYGELDLADALDLDAALIAGAETLKNLGSTDSLDVRRATALGDIARRQLTLDLNTPDPATDQPDATGTDTGPVEPEADETPQPTKRKKPRKPRQVVLYVHLSQAAVSPEGSPVNGVGRVENARGPVLAEQIRSWCGNPDAQVVVKPVIDLNDHIQVDAYEVGDRLKEQVALLHLACVFPWCTRPARLLEPDRHDADCDHIEDYADGGFSCSCNIAPLCRKHHRVKTHTPWTYVPLERGSYLWTSPHGLQFLRDHTGTLDVSADKHRRHPDRARPPDD